MFKHVKADFSAAVEHAAGLQMSGMHHKTVMNINEDGIGIIDTEVPGNFCSLLLIFSEIKK